MRISEWLHSKQLIVLWFLLEVSHLGNNIGTLEGNENIRVVAQ